MNQKGVSLFLTIMILSIILAIVFGLSAILISQIRTIKKMGDSVVAFYAADTGTEKALNSVLGYVKAELATPGSGVFNNPSNGLININGGRADYEIKIYCCDINDIDCYYYSVTGRACPSPSGSLADCKSTFFCIKSIGIYPVTGQKTKRAIETQIFPSE